MVANYICENCLKSFKTNQHLSQHKNRKKKCITYKEKDLTGTVKDAYEKAKNKDRLLFFN